MKTLQGLLAACVAAVALGAAAAPKTVLTFPVSDGGIYHVRVVTSGAGGVLRLGYLNAEGNDIEPVERALGYPVSARTAEVERDGETVLEARAGGKTGTRAAMGVVTLSDGGSVQVKSARWFAGECADGKVERSSGIDASMTGDGDFARNLLANPSFEEVSGDGPLRWRYLGPGEGRLVRESYAGSHAIKLTAAEEGGRWQSDPFDIEPGGRLEMLFAIRYSRHARPLAHINPVNIEFLDIAGRVVSHAFRWSLDHRYYTSDRLADWGVMSVNPYVVPEGAVQARVFVEHRDQEPVGGGKTVKVGWGDIFVDNIAVWQTREETRVPFAVRGLRGASALLAGRKPPRLPVGRVREGSVWSVQPVTRDFSFFFADAAKPPSVKLVVGNFFGYSRKLTLKGRLAAPDGKDLGPVAMQTELAPYELKVCTLPVKAPDAFGLYRVRYEFLEGGACAGRGSASFAWLARRPAVSEDERRSVDYPFDLHPTDCLWFPVHGRADDREAELRLAALLGAGGVRQQFWGQDISPDPQKSAAQASADVAAWRAQTRPLLKRYGLRSWVSYMEQHHAYFPRREADSAGWKAYWREFGRVVSNDVEFVLFGNEGIGGYAAGYGPDDDLSRQTAFRGTIRQWVDAYCWMRAAVHETNPALDVGFAMAGDESGVFTRQFYGLFPDIPREVWAINGYVRPPEMMVNCRRAMGEAAASSAYSVLPELGYVAHAADWESSLLGTAERIALSYLDVKAVSPQTRRCAWFIARAPHGDGHGVMSITYQPRPAAAAYAVMTDTLGAGRVVQTQTLPDGGRFHVWERLDGRRVGLGISPRGLPVAVAAKGPLYRMDAFGNRRPLPLDGTNAVVRLSPKPFYVLGDGLAVSERFTAGCETSAGETPDRATVHVRVRNLTQEKLALDVRVDWRAALSVDTPQTSVSLDPGEERRLAFKVRFVGLDGARPYRFSVTVRDAAGFEQTAGVELRFADRPAVNLLRNGDFGEVDEKGGLVGWRSSVKYAPGRPEPEVRFSRKDGAGPSGGSCASIAIAPPSTADAVLRLSQRIALKPSTRYYWSVREKSLKGLYSWPHAAAFVRDAQGRVVATPPFDDVKADGEWKSFEGGCVSPDKPSELEFVLLITNASRGEALYADARLIEVEE